MTYDQVWWPIIGICALHLLIQSAHTQQWTHTPWTHTQSTAAPGEQLGVSRGIKGGALYIHSPQLQSLPARDVLLFTWVMQDIWVCTSFPSFIHPSIHDIWVCPCSDTRLFIQPFIIFEYVLAQIPDYSSNHSLYLSMSLLRYQIIHPSIHYI